MAEKKNRVIIWVAPTTRQKLGAFKYSSNLDSFDAAVGYLLENKRKKDGEL